MSSGKKTTYPVTFKEEAVRLYLEGGRSYQQLADELGLKDKKRSAVGWRRFNAASP
jgi:transposase-like protein